MNTANMKPTTMKWLLQREFWEYKGSMFWAPLIVAALIVLLFGATLSYGLATHGVQRYWKSSFLKYLGDNVLDILVDRAATMPSPMSMVGFFHVHGAASRVHKPAGRTGA